MRSNFLFFGAVTAFIGVAMGAFGAHGLKGVLSSDQLAAYQTGVNYQLWHALGLCCVAQIHRHAPQSRLLQWAGWLMFLGILLFSGSLYFMTMLEIKWLGLITPLGGLSFLTAWLLIAVFATRQQSSGRYP